ncbi:FCD domain-containing protein [Microvirga makkahensis]|uniref:FCD domain-containing protein n=1 Tax=Microvirga makkahensis TaxID=1128670 RepID=A0A7X3SMZ5_9HYPH|nr:FCD domain-containing protein [Microvirga makkahensis]MXQ10877.1 FCD domain-containing protein [Microvirga makkahensis]
MSRGVELLDKVPVGRRSDAVAQELMRMIHSGDLQEGDRLPAERELMQRYGVSRSAVREAIVSLANRGLVMTRLGHRPIVRKPDYEIAIDKVGNLVGHLVVDRKGVWNLFDSRIFLEAALARWAASHARRDDIEDLRAALEANRQAIGNSSKFDESDAAFHSILYRIPGNPIYPAVHKAYVEWLMQHWRSMKRGADIDYMNYAGHEAIFDAITARDPDGAEEALRRHLVAAWEFVRSTFDTGKLDCARGPGDDS